jgi:hypothetical protein
VSKPVIPEDLRESYYASVNSVWGQSEIRFLIERIGRAEKERDGLRNSSLGRKEIELFSGLSVEEKGAIENMIRERDSWKNRALNNDAEALKLKRERDELSHGGCGKPGHTTIKGDEGTCYCMTCELEGQLAKAKQECDEANARRRALRDQLIIEIKKVRELEFRYQQPKEGSNELIL